MIDTPCSAGCSIWRAAVAVALAAVLASLIAAGAIVRQRRRSPRLQPPF